MDGTREKKRKEKNPELGNPDTKTKTQKYKTWHVLICNQRLAIK